MNLEKLFQTQKILRDRINYQGEDRFEKLVLALLVELGECANCWRGFKYWSQDQKPRTQIEIGDGEYSSVNPLLEEFVDGLHFILELGLELDYIPVSHHKWKCSTITDQFNIMFGYASDLFKSVDEDWDEDTRFDTFDEFLAGFVGLGEMLGFTEDEIESAYFTKNKINHQRQESGY